MKHVNVALFAVHEGCPHMCSFCNQKSISGSCKKLSPEDVVSAAKTAVESGADPATSEIAFFGGSFTMIERDYMLALLAAARHFVDAGFFKGIRISTRPDAIDEEICSILREYRVTSVELGAQSMNDTVLSLNRRGHTAQDVENASRLLKKHGFELGLQMMTGLYGSTDEDSIETAKRIIALSPDTVRIYPTVVLEGTELDRLMKSGEFTPQGAQAAADLGGELLLMFHEAGIRVIRFGLHSGGDVQGNFTGGAFHPALREMAESRIYLNKALLAANGKSGKATLFVNPREISKMAGQKKENLQKLSAHGLICRVKADESLDKYEVKISFDEFT